jgi:hypothetical protein
VTDSFKSLEEVSSGYEKFVKENPELVVIHINVENNELHEFKLREKAHIVPLRNLIAGDMVLKINSHRHYSLTYCLLCNSIHAYLLPFINGKEEINGENTYGNNLQGKSLLNLKILILET